MKRTVLRSIRDVRESFKEELQIIQMVIQTWPKLHLSLNRSLITQFNYKAVYCSTVPLLPSLNHLVIMPF